MLIIKIGGGANVNLEGIATDLAAIDEPCVVVHGANALRDELAGRLDTPKQVVTSVSGYDSVLSDDQALDVIMMSYAGLRNKRLVELCQRAGVNAIGLTGLDARLVQGKRNRGIRVRENGKTLIKRDYSGKPATINIALLQSLLDQGLLPVLTIPIADENGYAINSENDDIVGCLQGELKARHVVQLIEAPGLLEDARDEQSLIERLTLAELRSREANASGRIRRKLLALVRLLETGDTRVCIADGRVERPVSNALAGNGTLLVAH